MTTYYISPSGSDANNGLGPDASAVTNKPWLTIGKAMNTGSAVVPGDIVYIAPGYYYSAAATPISGITSAGSPTQFIGDPTNAQGFKDGSSVLLAPGLPWITTRTSGEGLTGTIASTSVLFDGSVNSPSGLQFRNLVLEVSQSAGAAGIYKINGATGSDVLFDGCRTIGYSVIRLGAGAPTAARNHAIRRCDVQSLNVLVLVTSTAAATADADLAITVEENFIVGSVASTVEPLAIGAGGGNIGGGINVYHNVIIGGAAVASTALRVSTVKPVHCKGNLIITSAVSGFLNAGTAGQIIDDGYNIYVGPATGNVNVTVAGTSQINPALNLVTPYLTARGLSLPRADFLGWTAAADTTQKYSASGRTTSDFFGRTARPWGAGASIGCFQSLDLTQDTGSSIMGGGVNSAKITGAGEFSLFVPVDASATTLTVVTKSASYGGTNYPQIIMEASPAAGVTTATATATDATEQTLTIGPFTPTAQGVVEIRLISRSSSGASSTWFDLLAAVVG